MGSKDPNSGKYLRYFLFLPQIMVKLGVVSLFICVYFTPSSLSLTDNLTLKPTGFRNLPCSLAIYGLMEIHVPQIFDCRNFNFDSPSYVLSGHVYGFLKSFLSKTFNFFKCIS